jgi:peptidoglycan hydrolase-like protein with peptidoglycan-binding domain
MCPDGTYVGRTGPNCEFICPTTVSPAPIANPTTPPLGEVFKKGMTSETLKDVQQVLKSDPSIYNGPVTGYYGAMTETAIKKVQARYGLPETGVLDVATQKVIFPYDTRIDLTIVSPNGGETWKAGEGVNILWKSTFGPQVNCMPRPACLDSTPRCLPPEPVGGWCPDATTQTMTASSVVSGQPAVSAGGTVSVGAVSASTLQPAIMPLFPRGTLTLIRDSDPAFSRVIGTVNLYESSKVWTVPAGIPEAKDYRVTISVGGNTPCVYRAETEAMAAGKALAANLVYPCPMLDANMGANSGAIAYPIYSASDQSDNTFAIVGGSVVPDERITAIKQQLANLEAMLAKIQEQIRILNDAVNKLQSGQ